ncbi:MULTISPECIES: hypothetical protein [Rhodopseudomonas]|uniref:hypothetical protein n=1 Tax=Rhodopseudomonas TaxID=1073 RepID=UPI00128DD250|nr:MULTISPECIES: hypothetical protein [Rhodopseudomonas]MDF3812565.1 hypothetical protein [Rhodopseudomonas sp. BAL398]WOK17886.1 hypothetical protein RBJ75_27890 [Rhodopseudomonas sp. BAL398]
MAAVRPGACASASPARGRAVRRSTNWNFFNSAVGRYGSWWHANLALATFDIALFEQAETFFGANLFKNKQNQCDNSPPKCRIAHRVNFCCIWYATHHKYRCFDLPH